MKYGIANHFVYIFHIPLFFFLSGLVFSRERFGCFKSFIKRKVKTLLIPYFIYSFVTWIIWALFSYFTHAQVNSYWAPLLQTFIAQGSGEFLVHNGTLWFITCLFVVECLYWWISFFSTVRKLAICTLFAVIGVLMVKSDGLIDFTLLPWNIEVAFMVIVFYAVGDAIKSSRGINGINTMILNNRRMFLFIMILLGIVVFFVASVVG